MKRHFGVHRGAEQQMPRRHRSAAAGAPRVGAAATDTDGRRVLVNVSYKTEA